MSIGSALLTGTAGLRANASAMAAVSDNIANVNTVGYKRLRNDFTAALNSQAHQTSYNAGGVYSTSSTLIREQGTLQSSAVSTHMAISGEGFFVTRNSASNAASGDQFLYTRAGQFVPNAAGYLVNTGGQFLYGWPVDPASNTVTASPTDLSQLEAVRVSGFAGVAEATTALSITANLDSSQVAHAAAYNAGDLAAYSADPRPANAIEPHFSTPLEIYDSQGGRHTVMFSFLKTGANTWQAEAYVTPASEITGPANGLLRSGTISFTSSGMIDPDPANSTFDPATPFTINASGGANPSWSAALGIDGQTISMDLGDGTSAGGLTQFEAESQLDTSSVNGAHYGALAGVDLDSEGYLVAQYSNGLNQRIYRVPVATFDNPDGLVADENSSFRAGVDAGTMTLRGSNQSEAGEITSHALETSTVDLAEEFSNLIVTQRAYSASSKIITTADEMLDELIRIKR